MSDWLACGRGADVLMTFLTLDGVNHSATSMFRGGDHRTCEGLHHQKSWRSDETGNGQRGIKSVVGMGRKHKQGRAARASLLPSRLTCAALTQLFIKALPMRCALSRVLIKASFLICRMALSEGLWGERDFLPTPPSLTLTRWFCWAPVTSQWPNRPIHCFFFSLFPSEFSIYFAPLCFPWFINGHTHTLTRTCCRWSIDMKKSSGWSAKKFWRKYFSQTCEKVASQFLKWHYCYIWKNVHLHSVFPTGPGWLIRSIIVQLVPR